MSTIIVFALVATTLHADDSQKPATSPPTQPQSTAPVEFKIRFWHYGVAKQPIASGEIVASQGKFYQTLEGSKEVVVFDPSRKRIDLIDLGAKKKSDLTFGDLDEAILSLRQGMRESIEASEKKNTRGGRIAAEMQRNLAEPKFQAVYDEAERQLKLSNPSIQIDATGEIDPEPGRLAVIGEALAITTKLVAMREEGDFSPFPQLDAFAALIGERKLRPAQMTFLFRLAGPPEKHRWVYEIVPTIPDRERAALEKVNSLLLTTSRISFDRYERLFDPDEIK